MQFIRANMINSIIFTPNTLFIKKKLTLYKNTYTQYYYYFLLNLINLWLQEPKIFTEHRKCKYAMEEGKMVNLRPRLWIDYFFIHFYHTGYDMGQRIILKNLETHRRLPKQKYTCRLNTKRWYFVTLSPQWFSYFKMLCFLQSIILHLDV